MTPIDKPVTWEPLNIEGVNAKFGIWDSESSLVAWLWKEYHAREIAVAVNNHEGLVDELSEFIEQTKGIRNLAGCVDSATALLAKIEQEKADG